MPKYSRSRNRSDLVGGTILEDIAIPAVFAVVRHGIMRKRGAGTRKDTGAKKNKTRRVRFSRKHR